MLDFEAFVFIGAHNWDCKNQGDEVGGSNNREFTKSQREPQRQPRKAVEVLVGVLH